MSNNAYDGYLDKEYEMLAARLKSCTDDGEKQTIMILMDRIRKLKMAQLNEEQKKVEIEKTKSEKDLNEHLRTIEIMQKKAEIERINAERRLKEAELNKGPEIPWDTIIKCGTVVVLGIIGLVAESNGHIISKFAGIFGLAKVV